MFKNSSALCLAGKRRAGRQARTSRTSGEFTFPADIPLVCLQPLCQHGWISTKPLYIIHLFINMPFHFRKITGNQNGKETKGRGLGRWGCVSSLNLTHPNTTTQQPYFLHVIQIVFDYIQKYSIHSTWTQWKQCCPSFRSTLFIATVHSNSQGVQVLMGKRQPLQCQVAILRLKLLMLLV